MTHISDTYIKVYFHVTLNHCYRMNDIMILYYIILKIQCHNNVIKIIKNFFFSIISNQNEILDFKNPELAFGNPVLDIIKIDLEQ